jgi:D-tyrosyl-tRNA(Tyr) deacylase
MRLRIVCAILIHRPYLFSTKHIRPTQVKCAKQELQNALTGPVLYVIISFNVYNPKPAFPMRSVIQRVSSASLIANNIAMGEIQFGLVVLLGIEEVDDRQDADWVAEKIARMRIFADEAGKMNLSIEEVGGRIMVISQFTLHASTRKGNRPSFIQAARPEQAIPLYEYFLEKIQGLVAQPIVTGIFGADMKVTLVNDGPVTIWLDSKNKE